MAVIFKELFFDDPTSTTTDDGLVWKTALRTGYWAVGPNGRALSVVAGNSTDQQTAIGLQDIVDSFEAGAIEHVTIPKSHDDRVDENTGYIRKVKIVRAPDGSARLLAGHDFTEPDIKEKVQRGSIANTSVGLEFDYVRKEDGRKFPVVMRHNALTNRPWINRMTPFGVAASEAKEGEYDVQSLVFSEPIENDLGNDPKAVFYSGLTVDQIKQQIESDDVKFVMASADSALVRANKKIYVAGFSITNGVVTLDDRDKWSEQQIEDDHTDPDKSTSEPAGTINPKGDPPNDKQKEGDPPMPEPTNTPPVTAEAFAEMQRQMTELTTKLSETNSELAEQKNINAGLLASNDQLTAAQRATYADNFVSAVKKFGFTEDAGCTDFLKKLRNVLLSDQGGAAINLSEQEGQTAQPKTVTQVIHDLFMSLPSDETTGLLKIDLAKQATDPLRLAELGKPPVTGEPVKLSEEEAEKEADALFDSMYPAHQIRTPKGA
jgi:hypothetical protein